MVPSQTPKPPHLIEARKSYFIAVISIVAVMILALLLFMYGPRVGQVINFGQAGVGEGGIFVTGGDETVGTVVNVPVSVNLGDGQSTAWRIRLSYPAGLSPDCNVFYALDIAPYVLIGGNNLIVGEEVGCDNSQITVEYSWLCADAECSNALTGSVELFNVPFTSAVPGEYTITIDELSVLDLGGNELINSRSDGRLNFVAPVAEEPVVQCISDNGCGGRAGNSCIIPPGFTHQVFCDEVETNCFKVIGEAIECPVGCDVGTGQCRLQQSPVAEEPVIQLCSVSGDGDLVGRVESDSVCTQRLLELMSNGVQIDDDRFSTYSCVAVYRGIPVIERISEGYLQFAYLYADNGQPYLQTGWRSLCPGVNQNDWTPSTFAEAKRCIDNAVSLVSDYFDSTCPVTDLDLGIAGPPQAANFCGDGNVAGGETCDDGNLINSDGCDNLCQIEPPINQQQPDIITLELLRNNAVVQSAVSGNSHTIRATITPRINLANHLVIAQVKYDGVTRTLFSERRDALQQGQPEIIEFIHKVPAVIAGNMEIDILVWNQWPSDAGAWQSLLDEVRGNYEVINN
ncbi:MAG: hypothetical protein Q8Q01_04180 [archaeon]|nr:hypothetical protein [archaeon]